MIPKSHEHQQAQNLYFRGDLSSKQICDILNINRKTLFTWAREGDWKRAKQTIRHAPSFLIEQYYDQLANLNEAISNRAEMPYPTKQEAAVIRTLCSSIKEIRNRTTPSEAMDLFMDFGLEVSRSDRSAAAQIMPFLDEYVDTITNIDARSHKKKYNWERTLDKEYEAFLAEEEKLASTVDAAIKEAQEKQGDDELANDENAGSALRPVSPLSNDGVTTGSQPETSDTTKSATEATNQNNDDTKNEEKNKNGVIPPTGKTTANEVITSGEASPNLLPGTGRRVIRKITLAPQPVRTDLIVDTRSTEFHTLSVLDPIGRIVKEKKTRRAYNVISVKDLPDGLYTLIVTDSHGNYSRHEFDIFH